MGKQTKFEMKLDEILAHLRQHLNEQRPITLFNTYKGVPIAYEAEVAMIHPGVVGLIVHPYQAVCIKQERRTYLQSKTIPELIRAYPISIDYTNNVVLLKQLKIPKSIAVDLNHSRIKPEKSVTVEIGSDEWDDLKAKMMEIAVLENNRVQIALAVENDNPYARQEEVTLAFRLESGGDLVQVQGVVHSLSKIRNQSQKRMVVEGKSEMGDEITILAYIAKREDQIMSDLDKFYKKLRKGKKRSKR